jgi:chromate reductase, NAD(P)H dehydrogenase (quinone)
MPSTPSTPSTPSASSPSPASASAPAASPSPSGTPGRSGADAAPYLLLISGSTRAGSVNTAVLRTVADLMAADGVRTVVHLDLALLPHFNPDDDHEPLPAEVTRLRQLIAGAGALLFCTPEYAGDLPGSFKNLLDWTVGGAEISGKPSAWINASSAPTRAAGAHAALRTVLGYTDARVVHDACVHVPVPRSVIDPETGLITDPATRTAIASAARELLRSADAVM